MKNRLRVKRRTGIGGKRVDLLPDTWFLFHWIEIWERNPWRGEERKVVGVVSLGFSLSFCLEDTNLYKAELK